MLCSKSGLVAVLNCGGKDKKSVEGDGPIAEVGQELVTVAAYDGLSLAVELLPERYRMRLALWARVTGPWGEQLRAREAGLEP